MVISVDLPTLTVLDSVAFSGCFLFWSWLSGTMVTHLIQMIVASVNAHMPSIWTEWGTGNLYPISMHEPEG